MDERERADKLAEAIEAMVQGRLPEGLEDDEELRELLKIAKIRLDAARLAAEAGDDARDEVFQRLVGRLSLRHPEDRLEPAEPEEDAPTTENYSRGFAPCDSPDQEGVRELQEVIGLRQRAAEQAVAAAVGYSDAVWQRVEARVQAQRTDGRGIIRWPFRRRDGRAADFGAAVDRMILGEPMWEADDSRLAKLVHVARLRRAVAVTAGGGFVDQQERVWARIRPRLVANVMAVRAAAREPSAFERRRASPMPKLAAAGAFVALVIAALGPIPTTGFAQHPAAELARFVVGQIMVSETHSPPPVAPVTEVLQPMDVTLAEARGLLALPVAEPTFVPEGYAKASSRYFAAGITSAEGGAFVLAYESTGAGAETGTVLVYQERASGSSIAVRDGFAEDIQLLPSGVFATHVQGAWQSAEGGATWGAEDGHTIVFDRGGLRTILISPDAGVPTTVLRAMADSLAGQGTPAN
jgi:hypothetical protein